ncbi:hypothetical protein AAG906_026712 [Vitis piasezkii]
MTQLAISSTLLSPNASKTRVNYLPEGHFYRAFWDFTWTFLALKAFLLLTSPLCVLQSLVTAISSLGRFSSPVILAFCTTATSVAVHLSDGPIILANFGLGGLSFFQQRLSCRLGQELHLAMFLRFYLAHYFGMASRGGDVSTSATGKGKKSVRPREGIRYSDAQKSIQQINAQYKKQFNVRLRFPFPSQFKQFLHFTKIPPTFFHPNVVRILIGCSVQNMLYHLDLSLLEVLFIYTIKMSGKEIFSLSAHIPSLQLVTGLPDSTKGAAKGHVVVLGPWVSSYEHPVHLFEPQREGETVLVPDEHHVVKDLSFYKEAQVADAKARQDQLAKRKKKRKEGTLRQTPGRSCPTSNSTTHPPFQEERLAPVKTQLACHPWRTTQTKSLSQWFLA